MTFNDLRLHLVDDCTKIKMTCNVCGEGMRRPFVPYHSCAVVYQATIEAKQQDITRREQELADAKAAHEIEVQVKEMKILELEQMYLRQEELKDQRRRIDEALQIKISGPDDFSEKGSRLASRQAAVASQM